MKSRPIQNNTSIKEGKPMKPIAILSLFAAMLMVSCTASRSGVTVYDDVYYSPKDKVVHVTEVVVTTNDQEQITNGQNQQEYYQEETQYYADPSYETPYTGSQYYTDPQDGSVSNYYYGDYYDYSYTSRLRRFHSPGFGSYYNDYYTNMYWYNYDPYYYGTSIYIGYGGYPSYYYGWGWPRRSYWSSWYSPYYMYGMGYPHYYYGGYSSYWMGYNHGYWDGYYGSYYGNDWYYNSNDKNSYYYGPRTSFAGNTGSGGNDGGTGRPLTFGERYEKAMAAEGVNRNSESGRGSRPAPGEASRGSNPGSADVDRQSSEVQRGGVSTTPQDTDRSGTRVGSGVREGQNADVSPAEGRQVNERPVTDQNDQPGRTVTPSQRNYEYGRSSSRPNPGYVRPDAQRQQPSQIQRQPQPYSSPRYTKPKTSEEFTSPAYRNPREVTRPDENSLQRQQTLPSQERQPVQTAPGREQQSQPRYTPPGRSNDNRQSTPPPRSYTPPTRSETPARSTGPTYTPPTRNNSSSPSYSAPSRSNSSSPSRSSSPSYSAPSRSSGSSSPPPSSSGSSGSSRSSGSSSGSSSGRGNR